MAETHPRLHVLHRILSGIALGTLAAVGAGWVAHAMGWLPPALVPFAVPLLAVAGIAFAMAEGITGGQELLRRGAMRFTWLVLTLGVVGFVVITAGEAGGWWTEDSAPVATLLGLVPLLGGALLADAVALRRASAPRLAVLGAALPGVGLLTMGAGMVLDSNTLFLAALPLLAFGGIAYFRARPRDRADVDGGSRRISVPPPEDRRNG